MKKLTVISILLICILAFGGCGYINEEVETTTESTDNEDYDFWNELLGDDEKDDSKEVGKVVYDKNGITIKQTGYKYHSIMGYLELKLLIENNSNKDLTFSLNGNVNVNGYSLDSYFYEEVSQGTKKNVSLNVNELKENGIKEKDLSSLSFKMDIYNTDDWNDTEDGLELNLSF